MVVADAKFAAVANLDTYRTTETVVEAVGLGTQIRLTVAAEIVDLISVGAILILQASCHSVCPEGTKLAKDGKPLADDSAQSEVGGHLHVAWSGCNVVLVAKGRNTTVLKDYSFLYIRHGCIDVAELNRIDFCHNANLIANARLMVEVDRHRTQVRTAIQSEAERLYVLCTNGDTRRNNAT